MGTAQLPELCGDRRPIGLPKLGKSNRLYSRALTFLDPGQCYLKESDTKPEIWGLQSQLPAERPIFPLLGITSLSQANFVTAAGELPTLFLMEQHNQSNRDCKGSDLRGALYRTLPVTKL